MKNLCKNVSPLQKSSNAVVFLRFMENYKSDINSIYKRPREHSLQNPLILDHSVFGIQKYIARDW